MTAAPLRDRRFSIEYPHNGSLLSTTVYASDWNDAEGQARALRLHGRVVGEVVAELPAGNAVRAPFAMLTWLYVSVRNAWRRL